MRRRFYYDPDMDAVLERGSNYFEERAAGPSVISDDVGAGVNGLKHMASGLMLDSKSRHRAENRARGLVEVGDQTDFASKRERPTANEYGQMVKDASDQIASNWNGTRDWLARQRER